jgi:hypothetical protein
VTQNIKVDDFMPPQDLNNQLSLNYKKSSS